MILESAVGPAIADTDTTSLTSTQMPLLQASRPSIAVGLEVVAGREREPDDRVPSSIPRHESLQFLEPVLRDDDAV